MKTTKTNNTNNTVKAIKEVNTTIYSAKEVRALRQSTATKEERTALKKFFTDLSLCEESALTELDKHLISKDFHYEISESQACTLTLLDSKQHTICKIYDASAIQFTQSFDKIEKYLQSDKAMCFARQSYKQSFVIRSYFNTLTELFNTLEYAQRCIVAFETETKAKSTATAQKTATATKTETAKAK